MKISMMELITEEKFKEDSTISKENSKIKVTKNKK